MLYSDSELLQRSVSRQDLALRALIAFFPEQKSLLPMGLDPIVNRRKYLELCASLMKQIKDKYLFGGGLAFYSRQVQEALEKGMLIVNLKSPIFKTYYLRRGLMNSPGYLYHAPVIFRGNNPVEMLTSQASEHIWDIGKDWLIVDSQLQMLFTFFQREISPITKLCFSEVLLKFEDAFQKQYKKLNDLTSIQQWGRCPGNLQALAHVLKGGKARHPNWAMGVYCVYSPTLRRIVFNSDGKLSQISDKVFLECLNGWSIAD